MHKDAIIRLDLSPVHVVLVTEWTKHSTATLHLRDKILSRYHQESKYYGFNINDWKQILEYLPADGSGAHGRYSMTNENELYRLLKDVLVRAEKLIHLKKHKTVIISKNKRTYWKLSNYEIKRRMFENEVNSPKVTQTYIYKRLESILGVKPVLIDYKKVWNVTGLIEFWEMIRYDLIWCDCGISF